MNDSSPALSVRALAIVLAALMGLLALTMIGHFLPLGPARPVVGLGIAVIKASLVAYFFMELREQNGVVRLFAFAALLWLLIMVTLTLADFFTRATW